MPIPNNAEKAIYTSDKVINGKLELKKGFKGFITKHTYNCENEFVFYPLSWKGYCITVNDNEFKKVKSFNKNDTNIFNS